MNLEEYREWLKENRNQEEIMAYEVAERVISYHTRDLSSDYEVELFPRYIYQTGEERLEYDLLIKIRMIDRRDRVFNRLIGVEFKEYDMDKVLRQAVLRSAYTDYMYVATRNVLVEPEDLLILADYGIGWVVWSEGFVKMLIPSKFRSGNVVRLMEHIARKAVERAIEEVKKESKIAKAMTLLDFEGVEV